MARHSEPALSVIVPTHQRPEILTETLSRLVSHSHEDPIEVIVVHGDIGDGSAEAAGALVGKAPWPIRVFAQTGFGPAPKRNRGIREAHGPVCLFLGDDTLPAPGLVKHHLDFHARMPLETDAMLGLVTPAPPLDEYPFIRWLHEEGAQFGYGELEPGGVVSAGCFWTANISVKRSLLESSGGFDEGFSVVACEDSELGYRLAREGLRIHFQPEARTEHFHPTDLLGTLRRMKEVGEAYVRLCELAPEAPRPTRPAMRHRLKAAAITAAMRTRPSLFVSRRAWRFLCDETLRESYWRATGDEVVTVGATLERIALADPAANPPRPSRAGSPGARG